MLETVLSGYNNCFHYKTTGGLSLHHPYGFRSYFSFFNSKLNEGHLRRPIIKRGIFKPPLLVVLETLTFTVIRWKTRTTVSQILKWEKCNYYVKAWELECMWCIWVGKRCNLILETTTSRCFVVGNTCGLINLNSIRNPTYNFQAT